MIVVTALSLLRPGSSPDAARAFERVKDEMAALDADALERINTDIPRAVVTVLGALPALFELRPVIAKELPSFPLDAIDKLETYALAAWYAHLLAISAQEPSGDFPTLIEEAKALRQNLLVAAEALAHGGLLDRAYVARIRSGQGHIDLAGDLVALATLFTNAWPTIETKTVATRAEVERAAILGPELLAAVGMRSSERKLEPSTVKDQRRRAYTLLARAYNECRRAVTYLRWWDGDAGEITPPFAGPRSKKRSKGASGRASTSKGGETEPGCEP